MRACARYSGTQFSFFFVRQKTGPCSARGRPPAILPAHRPARGSGRRRSKPHDRLTPDPHPAAAPDPHSSAAQGHPRPQRRRADRIPAPDGKTRATLRIRLPDRKLTADIAAKSLRKAQAAIREAGADAIALVLRGCLVEGDVIAEAGVSAQPKAKHSNDEGNGDCA
jgi:hypothetical protein